MNNQQDFQQRLAKLEKQKRVTVPRVGGSVDPALSMAPGASAKGGLFDFVKYLKIAMIVLIVVCVCRVVGTRYVGVDFAGRKAELSLVSDTTNPEYLALSFFTLVDPILVPLFDLNNPDKVSASAVARRSVADGGEDSVVMEMVNEDGVAVEISEPVPTSKSLLQRIFALAEIEHPNKPQLYYPEVDDGWTRITSQDMLFSAEKYYSAKANWKGTKKEPDMNWLQIPYMAELLRSQQDRGVSLNRLGYALYYNDKGESILIRFKFLSTLDQDLTPLNMPIMIRERKASFLFTENNVSFSGAIARYKSWKKASGELPWKQLDHEFYTAVPANNVQININSNAPLGDVVALINRMDMTTLSSLDIP